jgi:hypothetical protein
MFVKLRRPFYGLRGIVDDNVKMFFLLLQEFYKTSYLYQVTKIE